MPVATKKSHSAEIDLRQTEAQIRSEIANLEHEEGLAVRSGNIVRAESIATEIRAKKASLDNAGRYRTILSDRDREDARQSELQRAAELDAKVEAEIAAIAADAKDQVRLVADLADINLRMRERCAKAINLAMDAAQLRNRDRYSQQIQNLFRAVDPSFALRAQAVVAGLIEDPHIRSEDMRLTLGEYLLDAARRGAQIAREIKAPEELA